MHLVDGVFFFQAEDGIRDLTVTGVQTCALPISAHGAYFLHLGRRRADHRRRPGVSQNVFHLIGGESRIDGDVGGAGAQTRIVGQGPLEARFREDRDLLARPEAELAQAEGQRLHPRRRFLMCDVAPRAVGLVAKGGRMLPVDVHGVEEQVGQGTRRSAHGRSLTRNVTGEPGNLTLTPRLALAVTITRSGRGPSINRNLTAASPRASVVTVSTVTSACAVSLVTSVTGAGVSGDVIAKTTGRPASGVMVLVAATVSPISTVSESDNESGDADRWIVSSMGLAANSVSATGTP